MREFLSTVPLPCYSFAASRDTVKCQAYYKTLQWTFKYYTEDCPSWSWYYPYHYAPSLGDLVASTICSPILFTPPDRPFPALLQLAAVLPPPSFKVCLPETVSSVLLLEKNQAYYYPRDFVIDTAGKRFEWQGVVLLPFIDIAALRSLLEPFCETEAEEAAVMIYRHGVRI